MSNAAALKLITNMKNVINWNTMSSMGTRFGFMGPSTDPPIPVSPSKTGGGQPFGVPPPSGL
jgi:hypothetical protein